MLFFVECCMFEYGCQRVVKGRDQWVTVPTGIGDFSSLQYFVTVGFGDRNNILHAKNLILFRSGFSITS